MTTSMLLLAGSLALFGFAHVLKDRRRSRGPYARFVREPRQRMRLVKPGKDAA